MSTLYYITLLRFNEAADIYFCKIFVINLTASGFFHIAQGADLSSRDTLLKDKINESVICICHDSMSRCKHTKYSIANILQRALLLLQSNNDE